MLKIRQPEKKLNILIGNSNGDVACTKGDEEKVCVCLCVCVSAGENVSRFFFTTLQRC